MTSPGLLALRGLMAVTQLASPRLAARIAFELFCRTPDPKRVSAREASLVASAAPFMGTARRHRLKAGNGESALHEFAPAGARASGTALVLHGWGSRSEHMRAVVEGLLGRDMRVLALDLPGHGRSGGRRLNLALAVDAVRAAAERFGPLDAMVGHSFGGAVAVNAVAGSIAGIAPVPAGRLALIAAPSSMPSIFADFGRFLGLDARARAALADQVLRVAGNPLDDYVGAVQLSRCPVPTLVVHAPDDKEVAFDHALGYEAAGDHVRLVDAPGRGHRRILADEEVVAWVADHAAGQGPTTGARSGGVAIAS